MHPTLRRSTRAAALACALSAVAAASAGAASAATLTVNKACYVNQNSAVGAPMTVTGAGFAPGEVVDVSGGTVYAQATADSSGNFTVTTQGPILGTVDPATTTTTLTATGETSQTSASDVVRSTNLAVLTTPGSVRNVRRDRVKFSFSGFTAGKHIYGFYTHGRKTVRTRFGIAHGPCGTLTQRALLFPGGRPRYDTYRIAFESVPRYSGKANPQIRATLSIMRF